MQAYLHGLDVLGGDTVLGMFDIALAQRNMNDLKPVTVEIARILLRGGQEAINAALATAAPQGWKSWLAADATLPGASQRKLVASHIEWHANELQKYAATDKNAAYLPGNDLKSWVMRAYIESNASTAGAEALDRAWNQMWDEIQRKLAAIPKAARDAAISAASGVVEGVTGVPLWAWIVGGVGLTGLLGWGAWKLANSRAGGAIAGGLTRKLLR